MFEPANINLSRKELPDLDTIVEYIFEDVGQTLGFSKSNLFFTALKGCTAKSARGFAEMLLSLDRSLAEGDIRNSSKIALEYFTDGQEFVGEECVPKEGPLLVVANHAGAADSIGAFSCINRKDSVIAAGRRPMLEVLPNISRHLLYLDADAIGRMDNMRKIISKLKNGEAVILFPRGLLEPDPALMTGALHSIKAWSHSVGVFLAKVPETRLLPLLISQTVAPKAWKSPWVTWSKTTKRRHQLAMIIQIAMQRMKQGGEWKVPIRVQVGKTYDPRELSNTLDFREINESVQKTISDLLISVYPDSV